MVLIEWQMEQGNNSVIRRSHVCILSQMLLFPFVVFLTSSHSPSPCGALHEPAAVTSCSLLPRDFFALIRTKLKQPKCRTETKTDLLQQDNLLVMAEGRLKELC